jgi:predicted RNA binding protein YcfA (HicA-like mRNA interferase family)
MKGAEFVRRVQRLGRKRGTSVLWVAERGKGSHGLLYYGSQVTTVRALKEITKGALHGMLKQLGLKLVDWE